MNSKNKKDYELPTKEDVLVKLSQEEYLQYTDYCNLDEIGKRQAIWSYAKSKEPIPIELLPILAEILNKGLLKKHYRRSIDKTIFLEVFHLINGHSPKMNVEDACYIIGQKYNQTAESIKRVYNSSKFSALRKTMTASAKNQKN
jgi:hypothetical protein